MENRIKQYEAATDLIEPNFDGQTPRGKPIYLVVDWEEGFVDVGTRCIQIEGTPMREFHGLASRFEINYLVDARRLREWIGDNIMPMLNDLESRFDTRWDGHNWVAAWDESTGEQDIGFEWIELTLEQDVPTHEGGLWSARDWYQDFKPGVRADMTDEELQRLAEDERDIALRESDVVLDDDLEDYLRVIRDELRYDV